MNDAKRREVVNRLIQACDVELVNPDQFRSDLRVEAPEEWDLVKRCAWNVINNKDMYDGIEAQDTAGEVSSPVSDNPDEPAGENPGDKVGKDRVQRRTSNSGTARKVSRGVRTKKD